MIHFLTTLCASDFLKLAVDKHAYINEGIFSGNLSFDVSEGSTWRMKRSGFCGMRSKKVKLLANLFFNYLAFGKAVVLFFFLLWNYGI